MAPSPDGHTPESTVAAAAASAVAEPPEELGDNNGRRENEVVHHVDDSAGAANVEMAPQPGPTVPADNHGTPPAAASSSSQNVAGEVAVDVGQLEAEIVKDMNEVRRRTVRPSICRVHPSISEQEPEAYEPKLVSIGPLHHGKDSLLPMEEVKLRYLKDLLHRHPEENKLSEYISVICGCESNARMQYAEKVEPAPDKFVRMLVLDGCFIIENLVQRVLNSEKKKKDQRDGCFDRLVRWARRKKNNRTPSENQAEIDRAALLENQSGSGPPPPEEEIDPLSSVRWGFSLLRRDLMLLENQIPFFVLVNLFDKCSIPFTGTRTERLTLMEVALGFLDIKMSKMPKERQPKADSVHHLLHLQHLCLNPDLVKEESHRCSFGQVVKYPFKMAASLVSSVFFALLYIVLIHKWPFHLPSADEPNVPRMIPCATELHQCGVKFKRKAAKKEGGVYCYLKVSFTDGTLKIPFLSVQESTSSKLRNFIALEQCCPKVGSHFTSYAAFMDNIINTESDVAILRRYRIIESKLGSDEEVAKMFNTLCKGTHLNYDKHYNASLFRDVTAYCELPHHRWRATLKAKYLGNPWSIISLLGGIVLLFLTAVQAYFAAFTKRKSP